MNSVQRHTGGLSPEYALLGFLDQNPAYGYELHQQLLENLGHIWNLSLSQTYNILKRLEAQGYLEGSVQPQSKRPDRRWLHLTPAGQQHFEAWLNTICRCSVRALRVEFMTRLYFLHARNPADALRLTEAQMAALETCLSQLENQLATLPNGQLVNRLGLTLRIRQLASALQWLSEYKKVLQTNI